MIRFIFKVLILSAGLLQALLLMETSFAVTPGSTLIEAARNNDLPQVKVLIASKANVNAKTGLGETPLIIASQNGNLEIVRLLLAAKADVNEETAYGATAIFVASENGHLEIVRNLIGAMADLDIAYRGFLEPTDSDQTKGILVLIAGIFFDLFIIWLVFKKIVRPARWTKTYRQIVRYRKR